MARVTRAGEVHRHPMRVVTRRTGLSAELLRVWERRYGVVRPGRTRTGRRLYSDAEIERLRLLYRATLGGRGIGQIAELPTPALVDLVRQDGHADQERAAATSSLPTPTAEIVDDCVRAVERLDAPALEAVLRRAVVALPAAELLDSVVASLLDRVGTRWREGTLRPVHGHLAAAIIRRILDRLTDTASSPVASPTLVVATPAGQLHELGALLAASIAASEGWAVTYLGANLPAEDIAEAATATHARAIALSIVYPPNDRAINHELRRLRTLVPKTTTLLAGGASAPAYQSVLDEIGAERLDDLASLAARLRGLRRARHRKAGARAVAAR